MSKKRLAVNTMQCQMVSKTDVGRQRFRNEDNFVLLPDYRISVIADGMGGHVDGNIASQIAVDTLGDRYQNQYLAMMPKNNSEELVKFQEKFLIEAIQQANKNIFNRNRNNLAAEGMGTTIVSLQIGDGYGLTACVGDSRIYLCHQQKLTQITQDHSLVSELVRYNIIDKRDLLFIQNKNIITRALGMTDNVLVDTTIHQIIPGDIFLLCTDGLTDLLNDGEIEAIIVEHQNDLQAAVDNLVLAANDHGGLDNITVSLVKIE